MPSATDAAPQFLKPAQNAQAQQAPRILVNAPNPVCPKGVIIRLAGLEKGLGRLRQRTESGRAQRTRLQRFNALEIRHSTPGNRKLAPAAVYYVARVDRPTTPRRPRPRENSIECVCSDDGHSAAVAKPRACALRARIIILDSGSRNNFILNPRLATASHLSEGMAMQPFTYLFWQDPLPSSLAAHRSAPTPRESS
ncbi:unnamed protein product, partial [Iphiclides podalirius]